MFGLPEEAILSMLRDKVPVRSYEGYAEFAQEYLIANIAKVMAANNEAILFALEAISPDRVDEERR